MSDNSIIDNLEIIQDDLRKIEKQYMVKLDQDQLKRNVHKLVEKAEGLNLKNVITRPKIFNVIKKNSQQEKRKNDLFIEHHGDNKFKIKSMKIKSDVKT